MTHLLAILPHPAGGPNPKGLAQSNSYSGCAATWVGCVLIVSFGSADFALAVFLFTPDALSERNREFVFEPVELLETVKAGRSLTWPPSLARCLRRKLQNGEDWNFWFFWVRIFLSAVEVGNVKKRKKQPNYTQEFKESAVRLSTTSGWVVPGEKHD